jgi:hypothetical protein
MQNPYGNLPVSRWILVNDSIHTHGLKFEWAKYLRKRTKIT